MTTATERRERVARLANGQGWHRNTRDLVDVYIRGLVHVHITWDGHGRIGGASHHEDSVLTAYTRDEDKVQGWLAK